MIDDDFILNESSIIDDSFTRFKPGDKVVTIRNNSLVVLTITDMEMIDFPVSPEVMLIGTDQYGHILTACSNSCIPYTGDVIYLTAQNNHITEQK